MLVAFIALLAISPSVARAPAGYLVMVLYVGLPLGMAAAGVAGIGFFVGGLWARCLERNLNLAEAWPKIKVALLALVLLPVIVFSAWVFVQGLIDQEVFVFSRRNYLSRISWEQEPGSYLVTMLLWGSCTMALAVGVFRALLRAQHGAAKRRR
jgi:hypothetical protein